MEGTNWTLLNGESDKRALRCKECAEKRLNDSLAMYQGLD